VKEEWKEIAFGPLNNEGNLEVALIIAYERFSRDNNCPS